MPNTFFLSIFPQLFDYQLYAPLLLRLALGVIFIAHGYPKLFNAEFRTQFSGWLESMGFKPAHLWARAVGIAEFVGGIFIVMGFLTQIAAIILAVQFLVILFYVRKGQPFTLNAEGGREFDFLILFALLALMLMGPGAYAIDLPL